VSGTRGRPATRLPALVLAVAGALLAAGCGSSPAATTSPGRAPSASVGGPTLATSVSSGDGTSWAIVEMGGPAAAYDNFWQLFVRPAGGTNWRLATPAGVASNGGLVMAPTGAGSLVTGFRPSQDLTFSPLAATADAGAQWSQNAPLSPGLGDVPDALAGGSGGRLIALTYTGDVETSTNLGAAWTRLATQRSLARSAAGRGCGVGALTAAAWAPEGSPLVAANCGKAGVAGIFAYMAGAWRLAGPALPAPLAHAAVDVLGLATTGTKTTAILTAATLAGTSVLAAWSADGGAHWQLSPALAAPAVASAGASKPSVSIWADGSAGLVLPAADGAGTTGAVIGWQAAGWHKLPPLPARTATLAVGPGGQLQALTVHQAVLTAWDLAARSSHWTEAQSVRVTISYGSSG
jgi:hypothetical protein